MPEVVARPTQPTPDFASGVGFRQVLSVMQGLGIQGLGIQGLGIQGLGIQGLG